MKSAEIEAAVQRDLSATPISRRHMDLLWLPPHVMSVFHQTLQAGREINISALAGDAEQDLFFGRLGHNLRKGEIGVADLEWAMAVDVIAEQAEMLGKTDQPLRSIEKWREALVSAPGCDLYLMSMGTMFGALGMYNIALRYMEQAHQLNPQSPRITRNVAACKSYL